MPCNPISASDVSLPTLPDGWNGGVVPQLPGFDIPFPPLLMEDLQNLYDTVNMILPPGILRPNLSASYSKNIMDAVLSLLEKFIPFLMLYTFFMPILNMILCIIEILCAINNPVKLVKALIRLFRVCIPEFLALFPFFALILMILSLLLLILTIILYLIERILALIEQIIANIELLVQAVQSVDDDSVIAITIKLGDLLCIFQNVFVLLGAIILIFQVIEKLLQLLFKLPPCDDGDSSDDGCCTPDVCPGFIRNNKQITSTHGTLQYYNAISNNSSGKVVRQTSYQLYDASSSPSTQFNNITKPTDTTSITHQVFFPEGVVYTQNTNPNSVPYTIDLRFLYNPSIFGRTDLKGIRFIRIKNCIVLAPPTNGVLNYNNTFVGPFNGTLNIAGGIAYEDDEITIMKVQPTDDAAGSLNTVVALPDFSDNNPVLTPSGGVQFDQLSYIFKINHMILIAKSLITVGCHPDVAFNKNFINNTIAAKLNSNADALGKIVLPDVQATQDCVIESINTFRQSVSIESAQTMQVALTGCLNKLKDQTIKTIKEVVDIGFDPFKSDFVVDPAIQFTTKPIDLVVSLNEAGGNSITTNLPTDVVKDIAKNITAEITLGQVSPFTYDGKSKFMAQISSKLSGNGKVKVAYKSEFITILNNPKDTTITPTASVKELLYTFIQSPAISETSGIVRDDGDVARDGEPNE